MGNGLTPQKYTGRNIQTFINTTPQSLSDLIKDMSSIQGYHPGYRSDIDYTSIVQQHRSEIVNKDIEITKLKKETDKLKKEIEELKAQIEIINSPTLII